MVCQGQGENSMKRAIAKIVMIILLTSVLMLTFDIKQAVSSESPETEWGRTYGGSSIEEAMSVVHTSDGGYVLAGFTRSFGAGMDDVWLVKTNSTGHMEWNETYGGPKDDRAHSMILTSDGEYVMAGYTESFGAGLRDFWLVKIDCDGNMQWNRTYGGTNKEVAYSVVQTSDGGYAMAGRKGDYDGPADVWLVKANSTGHMQWNKTYHKNHIDHARAIIETIDGGYALAGTTGQSWSTVDVWLVKTNSTGHIQWNRTYGGKNGDLAESLVKTADGGYILACNTGSFGAGLGDSWLVKTDAAGNMQWNQTYGGIDSEEPHSVVQTRDGGYALAGFTASFGAGDCDFWLIKLAPEEILAAVDIDPDTLNLRSSGNWIAAYIELPERYNVSDTDVSTITLNDTVLVDSEAPTETGDYDEDGFPDFMVKFDRSDVISYILANVNMTKLIQEKFMTITLTITGKLNDGSLFEGSDSIRIVYVAGKGSGRRALRL